MKARKHLHVHREGCQPFTESIIFLAKTVVGTNTATCLPLTTALMPRNATRSCLANISAQQAVHRAHDPYPPSPAQSLSVDRVSMYGAGFQLRQSRCPRQSGAPPRFGVWHTVSTAQSPPPAQPGALVGFPHSAPPSRFSGRSALCANVTRKPVRLMNWDIKQVVIFILDGQIFPLNAVNRRAEQANKLTDTVVHADPISRLQVAKDQFRRFGNHWRVSAPAGAQPKISCRISGCRFRHLRPAKTQPPESDPSTSASAVSGETAGLPSSQSCANGRLWRETTVHA